MNREIDRQFEQKFILLFNQGFGEVMPQIEELHTKVDGLQKDMKAVKFCLDRIENRLDKMDERLLDHEGRIRKLEKKQVQLS